MGDLPEDVLVVPIKWGSARRCAADFGTRFSRNFRCKVAVARWSCRWRHDEGRRLIFTVALIDMDLVDGFSTTRGAFDEQSRDDHEVIGENRCANKQLEAFSPFGATALHAPAAK
jgi:hypothetical protein